VSSNWEKGHDNGEDAPSEQTCDFRTEAKSRFHLFPVLFMSHSSDIFPSSVKDKLFKTERGDVCLCLHEVWPSLLTDLGLLGPAMLISRSEQMALVSLCRQLDFVPVPGGTEMLDLSSGVCLETLNLGAVIAGQEAETENLSLHFFDLEGRGLFKVLLTPGADLDGFIQVVSHYAKRPLPLNARHCLPRRGRGEGAILAEERTRLQKTWASFDPVLGGDLLPGGGGVRWLDALRLAGQERAMFLTKVGLIKAMLAAYYHRLRLRITICEEGLHHETTVVPRRLERCGQCLHLFDLESEAHFFLEADSEIWVGFHGKERLAGIHIFSGKGQRRGVIQFAGRHDEAEAWNSALSAAAGKMLRE
jgi:putative heme degradation protein